MNTFGIIFVQVQFTICRMKHFPKIQIPLETIVHISCIWMRKVTKNNAANKIIIAIKKQNEIKIIKINNTQIKHTNTKHNLHDYMKI